jgi:hypothetical protein
MTSAAKEAVGFRSLTQAEAAETAFQAAKASRTMWGPEARVRAPLDALGAAPVVQAVKVSRTAGRAHAS